MTTKELYDWATRNGWTKDRHGHLHKNENGQRRIKVQAISVRLERAYGIPATEYSRAEKRWLRTSGAYLKDLSIGPGDKLEGLKR
jgi:hypothetical protein